VEQLGGYAGGYACGDGLRVTDGNSWLPSSDAVLVSSPISLEPALHPDLMTFDTWLSREGRAKFDTLFLGQQA
jgi:hypothetical protein